MAVENWIDSIAKLWSRVESGKGGFVRSYRVFEKDEFPEALTEFPCVINYVNRIPVVQYSASGPGVIIWRGVSEFHLTSAVNKHLLPYVMRFYNRIITVAASSITLGGKVSHFVLGPEDPLQPGILSYGSEEPHYGIIVNWTVKENPAIMAQG